MAVHGESHYDQLSGPSFTGHADIKRGAYVSRAFTIKNVDLASDISASAAGAKFTHLTASTKSTRFNGDATLNRRSELDLNGNLMGLSVRDAAAFFTEKPFAWSATAGGKVRLTATLARNAGYLGYDSTGSQSSAGKVFRSWRSRIKLPPAWEPTRFWKFAASSLPASHISFSGAPRGDSRIVFDSSNLIDLNPLLDLLSAQNAEKNVPVLGSGGSAHFDGVISDLLSRPRAAGQIALANFKLLGQNWDQLQSRFTAAQSGVDFVPSICGRVQAH